MFAFKINLNQPLLDFYQSQGIYYKGTLVKQKKKHVFKLRLLILPNKESAVTSLHFAVSINFLGIYVDRLTDKNSIFTINIFVETYVQYIHAKTELYIFA